MLNYRELFYQSQAQLADTIAILEQLTGSLKCFMEDCEEEVMTNGEENESSGA